MPNKISFVVASIDRDEQLQQCLASIEAARAHYQSVPVEVLVVIQKSKGKKDIQARFINMATFFYIDKIGLSVARNFAIEKSSGDYLVFLDDDAMVKDDFLEILSKNILKYGDVGAFCGKLWDPTHKAPFSVLFNNCNIKRLRRLDYQYFMGSAHVLSRRIINKIGLYNEQFGVGAKAFRGGEETEYFARIMKSNESVLYLPDLVFFHPIIFPSYKYAFNYGHAFGAMMMKNSIYDNGHFYVYWYILANKIFKMLFRLIQAFIFNGQYKALNERYHYDAWLRGIFQGIGDYVRTER